MPNILARKAVDAAAYGYRAGRKIAIVVEGGLHRIGTQAPYFSITANIGPDMWGCQHDAIEAEFPGIYTDLIAMHLSDVDGVPMHATANGWYNLAGYLNGAGERHHRGNSEMYDHGGKRLPTSDECLTYWADHIRLPLADARTLADRIAAKWNNPDMKVEHARVIDEQRPRWKAEADACIAKHGLTVFAD